jgi:ATP-binding cassette subfamily B protein
VRVANLEELIESLPLGYDTRAGHAGLALSGGQKQRLLIARAVYKDPDFLFFDEATSALDAVNERIIMENLTAFCAGRTVVVIAHRLSTVRDADQIVVLDRGRIVEQGHHRELSHSRGTYFNLVKNQLELAAG